MVVGVVVGVVFLYGEYFYYFCLAWSFSWVGGDCIAVG